ncbi:MAG: transglutaminase TgpA family protein [Janthinobacterium lividum]
MKRLASLARLPRDKVDTLLLLGSALLVLAPHAAHLPLWVSLLCVATLAWRGAITLRGKRMPSALVLLPIAVAAMAGIQFSYKTLLGRDAGVAMLVLLVAFKMLEMHARRDLYVVIFLCFFLVLTNFFYAQGIGTALLMVAAVLALLTTQLSFQFTGKVPPLRARLAMGARMLLFAAPIAVLLFFVFPRLGGPLWSMPGGSGSGNGSAKSGLSERMAPGQMSNLAMSDEPAFRVRFEGQVPPKAQLYWRGLVLDAFDGTAWTRGGSIPTRSGTSLRVRGAAQRYEVTLEPSDTRWLFALEMAGHMPEVAGYQTQVSHQMELSLERPLAARVRYPMISYPDYALDGRDALDDPNQWLLLPYGYNPRALAAGIALRKEAEPARRIEQVLRRFREQPYSYTLEPPLLGRHSVDEFLYGTRAGFCEHYSGAFVFLMRAAGIPARVVTGYQGGELNPIDGYVTVRQSDAHAWAEVWLRGRGWVRVDPTAAVAPERVRRNLAAAVERPPPFGINALRGLAMFGGDSLLGRLRNALGAVDNGWNQWVLNYTPERQRGLLQSVGESLAGWRVAGLIMLGAGVLLLGRILYLRREHDPVEAVYSSLCKRLAHLGLARAADEGPTAYAARIAASQQLAPPSLDAAAEFLRRYSAWRYAPPQPALARQLAATLKRLLSQVR